MLLVCLALPRTYPVGFARSLLQVYETHTARVPGRRDLRHKPQLKGGSPVEQFERMPIGDCWDDANLLEPLQYIYNSNRLRWWVYPAASACM